MTRAGTTKYRKGEEEGTTKYANEEEEEDHEIHERGREGVYCRDVGVPARRDQN